MYSQNDEMTEIPFRDVYPTKEASKETNNFNVNIVGSVVFLETAEVLQTLEWMEKDNIYKAMILALPFSGLVLQ